MTRICAYVEIDSSFAGGDDEQMKSTEVQNPRRIPHISVRAHNYAYAEIGTRPILRC